MVPKSLLMTVILGSMAALPAGAQPENLDVRAVQMREGKMFTIEVHPRGKDIEIKVVGNEIARAEIDKIGLVAEIRLPGRTLTYRPKSKNGTFVVRDAQNGEAAQMGLDLKLNENHEHFDVDLPKKR